MPQLPANFVSNISTNSTDMIASLAPFVTLVLGVLLAGLVIRFIIHSLK